MEVGSAYRRHLKHELRTCLNQILGFAELLLESAVEEGKVTLAAQVRAILGHAEAMRSSIAALTQEASLEEDQGKVTLYSGKLRALVSAIHTEIETSFEQAEVADQHDLHKVNAANMRLFALLDSAFLLEQSTAHDHERL